MSPIERALRNKTILEWFHSLPLIAGPGIITRSSIVVAYAKHLQCPLCEVVPDMIEQDDIEFIYEHFMKKQMKA